jgi:hypothetical protein
MKKTFLISLGLVLGLFTFVDSNMANGKAFNNTKFVEITKITGNRYQVALKQITGQHPKIVHAYYDEDTNKIIIDGTAYSWSHNPKYGREGAGQAAKYKYVVAGCYYFNWEYLGNGKFRQ